MLRLLSLILPLVASLSFAQDPIPRVNVFPKPSHVEDVPGEFRIDRPVQVIADSGCNQEAAYLAHMLNRAPVADGRQPKTIKLQLDGSADLGDEGYAMSVRQSEIDIHAQKAAGIFYGIQTLRQMLPPQTEDPMKSGRTRWSIPCADITDRPRFAWRGMLLDVSRHFFPKEDIERFLDHLAMLKMNVFHWHLVDDGGWRIQINKYPELTSTGAWRKWTPATWDYQHLLFPGLESGDRLYGGFYTKSDIREIVQYASERHITIVPEIEMPGHSMAALSSYPFLMCRGTTPTEWAAHAGYPMPNVYCAGKETTFKFLEDVLDEVMDLFPSKVIHIGGDEVDKFLWARCPDCQARMKAEGLKDEQELQSYFIKRIEKYLNSKGRTLIGWDEILEGGLAPNASVMSWRGMDGGIAAAQAGHEVVMTPTSHCYFDYSYQNTPTEHVFNFEPIPPGLTADQAKLIEGCQCNLWTEWVPDMATAEQRLFPRILALSEVAWSQHKDPDADTFVYRMRPFFNRMDALGINYYMPQPRPKFDAVLLNGPGTVEFEQSPLPGGTIRFTTDDTAPTAQSQAYSGPIYVSRPMVITAALFSANGAMSDPVHVHVGAYQPVSPTGLVEGLSWKAVQGQFSTVPDATNLPSIAGGADTSIRLEGNLKENYALQFDGFIRIDREGVYTFYTSSDDGSALSIGGLRVVDNDGPHGTVEKSGRIYLKPGYYPLRVGYFQAGGDQSLSASIQGPGIEKQALTGGILFKVRS